MTDVPASLRELARARLRERLDAEVGGLSSAGELQRLVEELRIHQVELELQNEELQRAQQDLESLHANLRGSERRYRELYEQAPVGFLRLDRRGFILELNGTAAEIFGVERAALSGRKLSDLVAPESQDAYFTCRRAARARSRVWS